MSLNNVKLIQFILFSSLIIISIEKIDISDSYTYPKKADTNYITIPILGTNDLHGTIFPKRYPDNNGIRYSFGGAINLYSYAKILREDWGSQFLWLDGGDQFQGGLECMLSDGGIMKDYYEYVKVDGLAIGNHDFDYGVDTLKNLISQSSTPYLAANIFDKVAKKHIYDDGMWKNSYPYKIYEFPTDQNITIKIGVIGLSTELTHSTTSSDTSNFDFEDYYETTVKYATQLKNTEKVNAVVLLTHFGPKCNDEEKMKLRMYISTEPYAECEENQEIMELLSRLEKESPNLVDAVVGGHVHDVVHHWINSIPVVESSGPEYLNVIYLTFDKKTGDLVKDQIKIEGPVPVCEKIWPDTQNCVYKYEDSSKMEEFTFHQKDVTVDQDLLTKLKFWKDIIDEKEKQVLGTSYTDLYLDGVKETVLTNFVNDIGKIISNSDFCFYNLGGYRTNWVKGPINYIDMFNMFPFNNTLYSFEMTGEEVVHMFTDLAGKTLYPFSGNLQTFTYDSKEGRYAMKDFVVFDGIKEYPINPTKTYRVCTNDFMANGGSAMYKVRKWYKELRNLEDHGMIRELFTNYLSLMQVIKEEFFIDSAHPRIVILN